MDQPHLRRGPRHKYAVLLLPDAAATFLAAAPSSSSPAIEHCSFYILDDHSRREGIAVHEPTTTKVKAVTLGDTSTQGRRGAEADRGLVKGTTVGHRILIIYLIGQGYISGVPNSDQLPLVKSAETQIQL